MKCSCNNDYVSDTYIVLKPYLSCPFVTYILVSFILLDVFCNFACEHAWYISSYPNTIVSHAWDLQSQKRFQIETGTMPTLRQDLRQRLFFELPMFEYENMEKGHPNMRASIFENGWRCIYETYESIHLER